MKSAVMNSPCAKVDEAVTAAMMAESVRETLRESKKSAKGESSSKEKGGKGGARFSKDSDRGVKCFNCEGRGHIGRDCPSKSKKSEASNKESASSSKAAAAKKKSSEVKSVGGHESVQRPVVTGVVNGCKVNLLIDSGSSESLLPESLFVPETMQDLEFRTVQLCHADDHSGVGCPNLSTSDEPLPFIHSLWPCFLHSRFLL